MTTLPSPTHRRLHFSRFDAAVWSMLLGVLLLILLLIWRGDQVGVPVAAVSPTAGATNVSTGAILRLTFAQEMDITSEPVISVSPSVSGTVRWEGSTLSFFPASSFAPDTEYTVTVPPGIASRQGQQLLEPVIWRFRTGRQRVLYMSWDVRDNAQLYVVNPTDGQITQLTNEEFSVLDFAVSPDGQSVVYSVYRADNGSDLWLINSDGTDRRQLFECADATCTQPTWSPDSRRLIYERRNFSVPGGPPGSPRLWWYDLTSGETVQVFQDSQWLGLAARFSPDGRWLSYISPLTQEVQVYNLETGQTILIPSRTGEPASWNPDSNSLALSEIEFLETDFAIHLFRVNVNDGEAANLSGQTAAVNDGLPNWSPDGQWIAFGRKESRTPDGKQIWIMRPDGSAGRNLTQTPTTHYGQAAWSPDGRSLAFQAYDLSGLSTDPAVWLYDLTTNQLRPLAASGMLPSWLP